LSTTTAGSFSVTVTDDNGCTATAGSFTVNQLLDADVTIDTITLITACNGQATGALVVRSSDSTTTFAWSNGSSDSSQTNLAAGLYRVTATNGSGCTAVDSVEIIAPTLPSVAASVQTVGTRQVTVPVNTNVTLIAGSTGFDYNWTSIADPVTGNANISNPVLSTTTATPDPSGDFQYIVSVSAATGDTVCTVTDTVLVTVEEPFNGIPDAFTPNGDNVNDLFRPTFLMDEEVLTFRIFNRWGQVVYNGDENHGEGWDGTFQGKEQPTEVYIYVITYQRASEPEEREVRGEVTLIR
jgi:gliding motility-associated-like protein